VWISYVMLTALVVSLGFLVLAFSRETTEETVEDIVVRGNALVRCGLTGIDITNLCQDTQTLNMDVTNTNDIKVEGIWVKMFDIYNLPQTSSWNLTIMPQKTKEVKIIKQGIIKDADISPVIKNDKKTVICQSRTINFQDVVVCDP